VTAGVRTVVCLGLLLFASIELVAAIRNGVIRVPLRYMDVPVTNENTVAFAAISIVWTLMVIMFTAASFAFAKQFWESLRR
jgi:uncharacterized membrane protein